MITALYAAILALLFFYISIRVIGQRRTVQSALGTGNDAQLERRIRVHGNFAEYVPFALLMLFLVESSQFPAWVVHGLGITLLLGRFSHAYGVSRSPENFAFRVTGMAMTFTVLLSSSTLLLHAFATA